MAGAHVHEHFIERFEVLEGEVGFQVAGAERIARAGDAPVEVPVGVVHDWWNAGATVAHVRVEVEADPAAEGRPAARFVSMIEAVWSLGRARARRTRRACRARSGWPRSPASTPT